MSERTDFREALQAALQTALRTSLSLPDLTFEAGKIDGPQPDRDIGCAWWEGKRPWTRDANEEESYFRVRVLRQFRQDQGGEEPRKTLNEILEETAEAVEDVLKANLVGLGPRLLVIREVSSDHDAQLVEAQMVAYMRNRTAAGG